MQHCLTLFSFSSVNVYSRVLVTLVYIYISNAQAPYPPPCLLSLCRRGLAFPRHYLWVSWACLGNLGIIPRPLVSRPPGRAWAIYGAALPVLESKIVNFGVKNCGLGLIGAPLGASGAQDVILLALGSFSGPKRSPFWPPFWHDFQTLASKTEKNVYFMWILRGS